METRIQPKTHDCCAYVQPPFASRIISSFATPFTPMKRYTIIAFCLLAFFTLVTEQSFAQFYINTEMRTVSQWDDQKQDYVVTYTESKGTTFKFNAQMTMFEHTTARATSTFHVDNLEYDQEKDRYELEVTSNKGKKYFVVIDLEGKSLCFLYTRKGDTYMVQHKIKNTELAGI